VPARTNRPGQGSISYVSPLGARPAGQAGRRGRAVNGAEV
jgi:hypothetical protein